MKIAIPHENGLIFQHFGHTAEFKLYEVEQGRILSTKLVPTDGQGHGALSALLCTLGADVLVCGGIGGGAKSALAEHGIRLYGGVCGSCDEAVLSLLSGTLSYDPDVRCSHHDHEHEKEEHTCSPHGCGKGHCHHGG